MTNASHFIAPIKDFASRPAPFQIEIFAWYLHQIQLKERFQTADIGACFDEAHVDRPLNIASSLSKLCAKKPSRVIRDSKGYRLSSGARAHLAELLPVRATSVEATHLLSQLLDKITDQSQRTYLHEALVCFKHQAYRAAIVMAWNLVFSDVLNRIFAGHISAYNTQVGTHGFKRAISKREEFSDQKESDIIKIARAAQILSKETTKILEEKLGKRNSAAHPSGTVVGTVTAEEFIFDLVENVMLKPTL